MSFLELAKKRYSVRHFDSRIVEKEKLDIILEAGRVAPTAANLQPQRLIVIKEKEGLEKLKKAANVYGAQLAIIIGADHNVSWKRPFDGKDTADIDASIVTDHLVHQATELGLGTIWVAYFDPIIIRENFNIPDNIEPIIVLGIGYVSPKNDSIESSPNRHDVRRKQLKDIVLYETF